MNSFAGAPHLIMTTDGCMQAAKATAAALLVLFGVTAVGHCGTGCLPSQGPTSAEQSYTTEIIACAATAGYPGAYDRASDMACRHKVDCKYGLGACP